MADVLIRPESPADRRGIDVVNISAFGEEDEARLVAALRNTPAYVPELTLVAENRQRILGHLMMLAARLEQQSGTTGIVALAPMAVLPSHSHRGIGSELVTSALQRAGERGFPAVVVAGYPGYYSRFGFEPAQAKGVTCDLPVAPEAVLVYELERGVFDEGGRILYPPLFRSFYETSH